MFISACNWNTKTDVMFECASPSGQTIVTFYRVSSGERPGDQHMKVNIRPAGSSFNPAMYSFAFRHGYDASIHWLSEHEIRIEYPKDSELSHQEMVVFGTSQTFSSSDTIKIIYQEKVSTHGYFMLEKRCFN